jgi:hypothetical protein
VIDSGWIEKYILYPNYIPSGKGNVKKDKPQGYFHAGGAWGGALRFVGKINLLLKRQDQVGGVG